jgi:hypothetical protein
MRKVLLTVVSAALIGASTLSGAAIPNAFAQAQSGEPAPAELDALEAEVASLETSVGAVCATDPAQCEALTARIAQALATLAAAGRISIEAAEGRLAAVIGEVSDANPQLAAALQEQLFVQTAATRPVNANGNRGLARGVTGNGNGQGNNGLGNGNGGANSPSPS